MSETIIQAITSGCEAVKTGVTASVGATLPLAMSIMALTLGIRVAINFFKSIAH